MKAHIENIMGIGECGVVCEDPGKPLIVYGKNEAGKSSFALAVGATLTRDPNPCGLRNHKGYVRDGASAGLCRVTGNDGYIQWEPGKKECFEDGGRSPSAHPMAVGLLSMMDLRTAEARAKFWEQCFMPAFPVDNFREDVMPHICDGGDVAEEHEREFTTLVEIIEKRGWDAAEAVYQEHGRAYKRAWQDAVAKVGLHKTYGAKAAATLMLPGWRSELDGKTIADAERDVAAAQEDMDAANVADAIEAADAEQLLAAEKKIPELTKQEEAAANEVAHAHNTWQLGADSSAALMRSGKAAKQRLDFFRKRPSVACPHCNAPVQIEGDNLVKFDEQAHAEHIQKLERELREMGKDYKATEAQAQKLLEKYNATKEKYQPIRAEYDRTTAIIERFLGKQVSKEGQREQFSAAEARLTTARQDLLLVKVSHEAHAAHVSVVKSTNIAARLKASGFRKDLVAPKRQAVLKSVQKMFAARKWGDVEMNEADLSLTYQGRALELWSGSTRWRVNAVFQAALALMTGSDAVIFDAADIMDEGNQAKFLKWLVDKLAATKKMWVIVCLTEDSGFRFESQEKYQTLAL